MNKGRWNDPSVPMSALALKLCEEAAEVGTVLTDAEEDNEEDLTAPQLASIIDEIRHVEFIAGIMYARVQAVMDRARL